jgi:hypothetical protein
MRQMRQAQMRPCSQPHLGACSHLGTGSIPALPTGVGGARHGDGPLHRKRLDERLYPGEQAYSVLLGERYRLVALPSLDGRENSCEFSRAGGRQAGVGTAGFGHLQAASDEFVSRNAIDSVPGELKRVQEIRNEPVQVHRAAH